jgi:hypothetical protein
VIARSLAGLTALLLAGCATQPVATVAPICGAMRTVWVSKDDVLTPPTASQIEGNNLAYSKLCGRPTPPPPRPKKTEPQTS